MQIIICQFLALLMTVFAYVYQPWSLIYAIAMAHYIGSIVLISPGRRFGMLSASAKIFAMASLGIAILLFIYAKKPIYFVILFGIHHLFTEYYLDSSIAPDEKHFVIWRRCRNVFVTLLILFIGAVDFGLQRMWLAIPMFVVLIVMLHLILTQTLSSTVKKYTVLETVFWGLTMTLVTLTPQWLVQDFIFVSLYHFLFWLLYPIFQNPRSQNGYLQIPLILLFLLVITIWPSYKLEYWESQFLFWAYFHIVISVVSSDLNPLWIRQWLGPHLKT